MYNLCNLLSAGSSYIFPIIAGVVALVLLIVLMVFTVLNLRKKKSITENQENVTGKNVSDNEKPHNEEPQIAESVAEEATASEPEKPTEIIEAVEADEPDDDEDDGVPVEDEYEVAPKKSVARINGAVRYIIIKYNKSFTAKLIQSDDGVKNYYSALKNELLSYNGIKARMSWKGESFYCGRKTYAKLCIRGKCVCLFLALDAKNYAETKYKVDDMSEVAAYERIPCLYRIKNGRRLNYAADLIAEAMEGREKAEGYVVADFAKQYPYEEIEPLIERKLVKVLTEEDAKSGDVFKPRDMVTVTEANELLQDDIAVALIEETDEVSDKSKTDIINIDTLSKCFEDGETVTLEEIKKRVSTFSKKATAVKVLARGKLDKKLTVIADSYSIEAAKMILLTGGNAVKKKNS